jgi:TetR/AcrR family transcriptional regulator, transcriptional repressor of bet genes
MQTHRFPYAASMPKLVDHAQRRREIAEAVWGVIAVRGIEGVTLRAVAVEAGISVGRIQHYYPSREELVRDSCRVMLDLAVDSYDDRSAGLDPVAALRTLVLRVVPTTEGFRLGTVVWAAYVAKSVDDPEIASLVGDAQRGGVELAARLIEQARLAGSLPAGEDATQAALRLLACADGYATRVLVGSLSPGEAVAALERDLHGLASA